MDEVVFPATWFPDKKLLDDNNYDFTAHDALPYIVPGMKDCFAESKDAGMFLPTLRTDGLSTTDILTNILKNRVSPIHFQTATNPLLDRLPQQKPWQRNP